MQEHDVMRTMLLLAAATPVVGILLWWRSSDQTAEHSDDPPSAAQTDATALRRRGMRRKAVVLMLAGPLNLLAWLVLNGWLGLQTHGGQSVVGYLVAAVVFVVAGFATGFFGRLRGGRANDDHPGDR